jgi:ribosomal protein L44E
VTQDRPVKFGLPNAILRGMPDQDEYQIIVICSKCNASGVAVLWDEHRRWSDSIHESGSHLRVIPDGFSAAKTRIGFKFTCTDCGLLAEAKDYGS